MTFLERRASLARRYRGVLACVCALLATPGCRQEAVAPEPRHVLRLTTGPEGGGFYPLGAQVAAALESRLTEAQVEPVFSPGAVANVEAIQRGDADLALTFADVAYLGFNGRLEPASPPMLRLRGVAVLHLTPVALAARPGLNIRSPAELRGLSVAVGPPGSGTALTARLVLEAFGLDSSSVSIKTIGFSDAARRLLDGRLDAMFDNAINQAASLRLATEGGASLVPIEGGAVDRLRGNYPFLRLTSITPTLYPAIPHAIHTVGVDGLLICRQDLPDDLVYRFTKEFFAVLPQIAAAGPARMNVELAPATPIPLHPGAARYYREQELLR